MTQHQLMPVALLTECEEAELLDWVSACQSAYAMEQDPRGPFRPLPGQLRDNRQGVVEYVNEILESRTAPQPAKQPLTDEELAAAMTGYGPSGVSFPALRRIARAIEAAHGITGEQK